jgi:hypothetical protein
MCPFSEDSLLNLLITFLLGQSAASAINEFWQFVIRYTVIRLLGIAPNNCRSEKDLPEAKL